LEPARKEARRCRPGYISRRGPFAVDRGPAGDLRQRGSVRRRCGIRLETAADVPGALTVTADTMLLGSAASDETMRADLAGENGSALLGQAAVIIWNDAAPEGRC